MFLKALKNVRNQVIAFLIFQLTAQETQFLLAITLLMEMLLYALQPTAFPIWRFCHFTVYVANLNVLVYQYFTEGIELFFQD